MLYFNSTLTQKKIRAERYLLIIGIALFSFACAYFKFSLPLDRLVYDTYQNYTLQAVAEDIVIVAIDEKSLLEIGRWPWPRKHHAELIARLNEYQAKGIAFDIIFSEPYLEHLDQDTYLSEAIRDYGKVVLPIFMQETQRGGHLVEIPPIPILANNSAALGHVHVEVDEDGINRSVYLREGLGEASWPHISLAMRDQVKKNNIKTPGIRAGTNHSKLDGSLNLIKRDYFNFIPFVGKAGSIPSISYVDILQNRVPNKALSGKAVFVGATAAGLGDYISTPFGLVSGVEITANIYNALVLNSFIIPVDPNIGGLINGLLALLILLVISKASPKKLTLYCVTASVLFIFSSYALVHVAKVWISPVPLLLAVLIFYPLWNWCRLEIALSYLKRELVRVENESSLILKTSDSHQVIQSLEFLNKIAPVKGWMLTRSNETLSLKGDIDSGIDQYLFDNKPVHSTHHSTVMFKLGEDIALLVVQWDSASNTNHHKLLDILIEEPIFPSLDDANTANELVAGTIDRLTAAKDKLDEGKALLQNSLKHLTDGVILANTLGRIFFINNKAISFFQNYDRSLNLSELLNPLDVTGNQTWDNMLSECIIDKIVFSCETNNQHLNSHLLCKGSLETIQPDKSVLVITLTDVTELKQSEKAREESLHFLSHDLRSPMVSVLALIELANRNKNNTESLPLLNDIGQYVEKCLSYADSFLQLARAENDEHINYEDIEIQSLIDNVLAQVYHIAQVKQIELEYINQVSIDELWLKGDRDLLERALVNILDNAIKHSEQKSKIILTTQSLNKECVISVRDFGRGISEQDLVHLFTGFYKGKTHNEVPGIGLGLRFVHTVCQRHGGSISVESQLDHGATFTMTLPKQ